VTRQDGQLESIQALPIGWMTNLPSGEGVAAYIGPIPPVAPGPRGDGPICARWQWVRSAPQPRGNCGGCRTETCWRTGQPRHLVERVAASPTHSVMPPAVVAAPLPVVVPPPLLPLPFSVRIVPHQSYRGATRQVASCRRCGHNGAAAADLPRRLRCDLGHFGVGVSYAPGSRAVFRIKCAREGRPGGDFAWGPIA
jgi:hypothetical protein